MDKEQAKKLARAQLIAKHPELAASFALQDLKESLQNNNEKQNDAKMEEMKMQLMLEKMKSKGEQGEPGYTPLKGVDYMTEEEMSQIIDGMKEDVTPVKGVDYFDGEDGESVMGPQGEKGDPGQTIMGPAGKNGSPDSPEDIAYKLNMLEQALDYRVLKNIPQQVDFTAEFKKINDKISNQPAKGILDQRWHGGGATFSASSFAQYAVVIGGANSTQLSQVSGLGTSGFVLTSNGAGAAPTWQANGNGSVSTVSVVSANGFAGTVASPTTTPAITLSTTITGILKGNGTAISAATPGTDYQLPYWTQSAGTLFPTTTSNRILLGGAVDDTSSILQAVGDGSFSGNVYSSAFGFPVSGYYQAGSFDGSSDISGSDSGLPQGNDQRTITAWVKTTDSGSHIVSWGSLFNSEMSAMVVNGGDLYWAGYGADVQGTIPINDNNWHFVAVTYDSTTIRLYVDGVADSTGTPSLNTVSDGNFQIGKAPTGQSYYLTGRIEEVQIYNTALNPTQLGLIYNSGSGYYGIPSALTSFAVAGYHLNGNANDFVGSNNGTWSGTETYATGIIHNGVLVNTAKINYSGDAVQILDNLAVNGNLELGNGFVINDGSVTLIDPYNHILYASDGVTSNLNWATAGRVLVAGANDDGNSTLQVNAVNNGTGISLGTYNLQSPGSFSYIGVTGNGGTFNNGNPVDNPGNGASGITWIKDVSSNSIGLGFYTHLEFSQSTMKMYIAPSGAVVIGNYMTENSSGALLQVNGGISTNGNIYDSNSLLTIAPTSRILYAPDGSTSMLDYSGSLVNIPSITASRTVVTDGSSNLTASSVTATELGYLSGVSSAIQTQLDAKANFPFEKSTNRSTGQTGAKTLTAFTVGGSDASFIISANVNITTSTLYSFTVTCTYTDETNTSRTLTLNFSQLSGTFVQTLTNALGAGVYEGVPMHIRAKAGTTITIASTGTFTTVTYNIEQSIMELN